MIKKFKYIFVEIIPSTLIIQRITESDTFLEIWKVKKLDVNVSGVLFVIINTELTPNYQNHLSELGLVLSPLQHTSDYDDQ